MVNVNDAFQEQSTFVANKLQRPITSKNILSTKLQEQLHDIVIRMFKISVTKCWEIINRIQKETQQPQKRCHQKRQYTSIKPFRH